MSLPEVFNGAAEAQMTDAIRGLSRAKVGSLVVCPVLAMPADAWEAGFASGKRKLVDRCPYVAGSAEAWAWSSGRVEGQAARDGYETIRP